MNINKKQKTSTTELFVSKAKIVHNNKYVYSKVNYIRSFLKVIITCPIHGDFEQTPNAHLTGNGCRKCYFESLTKSTDTFIKNAIAKHGNKYTYDKTVYITSCQRVTITCPIHGDFQQRPGSHLTGRGCGKCGHCADGPRSKYSTLYFIKRADLIHNHKYIYDKTIYRIRKDKVIITCPIHGDFKQVAGSHLQGSGCKQCAVESRKITRRSKNGKII